MLCERFVKPQVSVLGCVPYGRTNATSTGGNIYLCVTDICIHARRRWRVYLMALLAMIFAYVSGTAGPVEVGGGGCLHY